MWYPDGRQSFSENYKNNLKDGVFESFDQSENISRKGIYRGENLVSGESVVQDLVYDEPDVPARFIGGDNALNVYLKRKTANFTAAKNK